MKKLASILLALILLLSLSVAVFADEPVAPTGPKITVEDGRRYEVYQIFTGDLSDSTLSNIKWGQNGTGTPGAAVDSDTLIALAAVNGEGKTDAEKLDVITNYFKTASDPLATVDKDNPYTAVTGYYLLKDVTDVSGSADQERSIYVVELVGNVSVTAKVGQPVPDKKVTETNDSTGTTTPGQITADYDLGDNVPFQLSATITENYASYKTYYLCFHDTLSAGLTFNNDVKVYVGGSEITSGYVFTNTGLSDGCSFHVEFTNLKDITSVTADSVITVEYTAKLNDQAVIGSTGNPNKVKLEYSNDPNSNQKGSSSEKEVKVYTYELIINKVDGADSNPLAGAGFTLYKFVKADKDTDGTWVQVGTEVTGTGTGKNVFTWSRLDAGQYKLVETTTPAGYNTMADKEFIITSTMETNTLTLNSTLDGAEVSSTAGTVTANIANNKGTVLPETGASGTTLFLIFGSMLTLAAVVFLVVRKKMSIYED